MKLKHAIKVLGIKMKEKTYKGKVKYIYKDKKRDTLLIVFSAFTGGSPKYNYLESFKDLPVNQLFILDTFGYKGSYYWFEHGQDYPETLISELVENMLAKDKYKRVITAGTSKGGTAAIYFGLKHGVHDMFSGACQYYVGDYLEREEHINILKSLCNDQQNIEVMVKILNEKMKNIIREKKENHGYIHLLYSKLELTYERQIIPMMAELDANSYIYEKHIEKFENHSDVGKFFPNYLIKWCEENLYG